MGSSNTGEACSAPFLNPDVYKRQQVQQQPKLRIGVRIDGDLLNLNIDAERLTQWEIQELLRNYRQRRK